MFFSSPSLKVHLLRGAAGFGFLAIVFIYGSALGWWTLIPAAAAIVCLGGCPFCWLAGIAESMLGGPSTSLCLDGSCDRARDRQPAAAPPESRHEPAPRL